VSDGTKARALLERLAADGEREALAVVARAREEAERITAESAARQASAVAEAKARHLAMTAEREAIERIEVRAGARRSALGARQGLVDRVIAIAISGLAKAATADWLAADVAGAMQYLPEGAARVRCAARDVKAVTKLVAARAGTSVAADDKIAAGVRVEMEDGSLVVDATAESRLERMRGAIAIELVAAVEGAA